MRRAAITLLTTSLAATAVGLVAPVAGAAPARAGATRASSAQLLHTSITRAFRGSTAKVVDWRFDVTGVGSLQQSASRMTAPASNNKLLTAQTALARLGAGYVFQTPVGTKGSVDSHGVLHGHLVVRGSGDPLLADANLRDLAKQIRQAGITRVTGGLIVDDSRYVHRTTAPGWRAGFTPDETGPIDAFAVDGNEWNHSATYIAHTGVGNGHRFVQVLRKHGVRIVPDVRLGSYSGAHTIATETSQPLSALVSYMLTVSYNFEAEMMLDELGAVVKGQGQRTTGLAVVRAESRRLAAPLGQVYDGSGLSYSDRESPTSLVRWLEASSLTPTASTLRAGLPIACETGTLEYRMCGRWTKGRVFAKTGTLTRITTLSGYTTTRSGRPVTFSILVSRAADIYKAEAAIDRAVNSVASFNG